MYWLRRTYAWIRIGNRGTKDWNTFDNVGVYRVFNILLRTLIEFQYGGLCVCTI